MACKGKGGKKAKESRKAVVLNLPLGGGVKLLVKDITERRAGYPGRYFCARNGLKL